MHSGPSSPGPGVEGEEVEGWDGEAPVPGVGAVTSRRVSEQLGLSFVGCAAPWDQQRAILSSSKTRPSGKFTADGRVQGGCRAWWLVVWPWARGLLAEARSAPPPPRAHRDSPLSQVEAGVLPQAPAGAVWVGVSECPAWSSVGAAPGRLWQERLGEWKPSVGEKPI